ncbi:unnamed protein product, partial [Rhizoctonia solani]
PSNGNADDTADELREGDERATLRNQLFFPCILGLDRNDCVLESTANPDTKEDLESDFLARPRVRVEGIEQARADRDQKGRAEQEGPIATSRVDHTSRTTSGDNNAKHKGENVDTGASRRVALGDLKVDGKIVGAEEQSQHDKELKGSTNLSAATEHRGTQNGTVAESVFPYNKCGAENAKHAKERNDNLIIPWTLISTPLQRKEQGSDHTECQDRTEPVEREPFLESSLAFVLVTAEGRTIGNEENDRHDSDHTKRQVDVEAPTPRDVVGECTTEEGADDTGERKNRTECAK